MPLTKRQREILNYLTLYSEQKGYAPSFEEIADNFNYNSLATVHEHLSNLERKGMIKRSYNESRAIESCPANWPRPSASPARRGRRWCLSKRSHIESIAVRFLRAARRQPLRPPCARQPMIGQP